MRLRSIFSSKFPVFLLIPYLIPFAFLLWFVTGFGVNVPYGDQWELVSLFQNIVSGKATFQDFFAQQNEHRILFPRLIISALALMSGWNIQWELYLNITLAAIVFLSLFKISLDQTEQHNKIFHIANISTCFIIFSVVQWENWLWGFQIAWFLVDVCLVIAILAFSSRLCKALWLKLAVAASVCFVASFSLSHGLLTWIAVVPSLRSCCKDSQQFRKIALLWLFLFSTACFLYLFDYHKPPGLPSLFFFLREPQVASTYFLTLLGSPLLYASNFSAILGLIALLNFVFFAVRYAKSIDSKFSNDAAPWLSMGCFAILFDLITTVGRAGLGVGQASSSRYTTVSILLLVALVQLWRLTYQLNAKTSDLAVGDSQAANRQDGSVSTFVIGILTFLVLVASINSLTAADKLRSHLQYGQVCLEVVDYVAKSPDNCIQLLYPEVKLQLLYPDLMSISDRAKTLNQIGFGHFRGRTIEFAAESTTTYGILETPATAKTPAIVRKSCLNCGMVNVSGWAILPEQSNPARLVLLSLSNNPGTFLTNAYVNLSSPDVAKALGSKLYKRARWQATVSPTLLPLGKTVLHAWVYDPNGKQFIKLRGEPTLSVED